MRYRSAEIHAMHDGRSPATMATCSSSQLFDRTGADVTQFAPERDCLGSRGPNGHLAPSMTAATFVVTVLVHTGDAAGLGSREESACVGACHLVRQLRGTRSGFDAASTWPSYPRSASSGVSLESRRMNCLKWE